MSDIIADCKIVGDLVTKTITLEYAYSQGVIAEIPMSQVKAIELAMSLLLAAVKLGYEPAASARFAQIRKIMNDAHDCCPDDYGSPLRKP